jgi:hypothetical protein
MRGLVVEPEGWPCRLAECPPGLFVFGDSVCLKTEYARDGSLEVYCQSGEYFWGGTTTDKERRELIVQPVTAKWREI